MAPARALQSGKRVMEAALSILGSARTMTRTGTRTRTYTTHDNGGRPFRVRVSGRRARIFRRSSEDSGSRNYDVLLHDMRITRAHGTRTSVLLELGGGRCVFVGERVYQFSLEAGDAVHKYHSKLGNSDVPYPVLQGRNNLYMMLDCVWVPHGALPAGACAADAYTHFYAGALGRAKKMSGLVVLTPRLANS